MSRVELLRTTMEWSYQRLWVRLAGLIDDEFFWQPTPDSWTVYEAAPGQWTYHYAEPDPEPAPVTTIGWQVVHVATCKVMYHEWAYGAARLSWPELVIPGGAAAALALLERGQELLRADLVGLSDSHLDEARLTNWGERWPAWRIFWSMADHDALHGGAIGQLRDLYAWTRPP